MTFPSINGVYINMIQHSIYNPDRLFPLVDLTDRLYIVFCQPRYHTSFQILTFWVSIHFVLKYRNSGQKVYRVGFVDDRWARSMVLACLSGGVAGWGMCRYSVLSCLLSCLFVGCTPYNMELAWVRFQLGHVCMYAFMYVCGPVRAGGLMDN